MDQPLQLQASPASSTTFPTISESSAPRPNGHSHRGQSGGSWGRSAQDILRTVPEQRGVLQEPQKFSGMHLDMFQAGGTHMLVSGARSGDPERRT